MKINRKRFPKRNFPFYAFPPLAAATTLAVGKHVLRRNTLVGSPLKNSSLTRIGVTTLPIRSDKTLKGGFALSKTLRPWNTSGAKRFTCSEKCAILFVWNTIINNFISEMRIF